MASPSNDLLPFLQRQLERGGVLRFVLQHVDSQKRGSNVEQVEVPDEPQAGYAEKVAGFLLQSAQSDANAFDGVQGYAVGVAFKASPDKLTARQSFRLKPRAADEVEEEGDPSTSEPANVQGLVAQTMRHNEALMKMATTGAQQTIAVLTRQLLQQSTEVERMRAQLFERERDFEKMASDRHVRDMEMRRFEAGEKRKDELIDLVMPLVPMIGNKLVGVRLLPGGLKEGDGLKALVASITEGQMGSLMEVLTPSQQALLGTMIMELRSEKEKAEDKEAPH